MATLPAINQFFKKSNGLVLVLMSSLLLGIWAVESTIALRNILLWVGGLASLYYWFLFYVELKKKKIQLHLHFLVYLAIGLVAAMMVWVLVHYLFFTIDPQRQFHELKSTWVRACLAIALGSATGLCLLRNRRYLPIVWLGLLCSFFVLIYQYIPKALLNNSFFGTDYYGDYIYWAKFNGVLAGTLLIAGLLGLLIDQFVSVPKRSNLGNGLNKQKLIAENGAQTNVFAAPEGQQDYRIPAYSLLGIFIAVYSFVFIFDAKAGVGLAIILIVFWIGFGLIHLLKNANHPLHRDSIFSISRKALLFFMLILAVLTLLTYKHMKNNPGWENLFTDIAISADVEKYTNWHNPVKLGYPLRESGESVRPNTYERVSWGVVGLQLIQEQPFGYGVFRSFAQQLRGKVDNFTSAVYTHSAWIDLGLAFGVLGLVLLPFAIMLLLLNAILTGRHPFRGTIISICVALLVLYGVGEYAFQHGIEILLFFCGFLLALSMWTYRNSELDELSAG